MIPDTNSKCSLCGGKTIKPRYEIGKVHKILRCNDCTFMWLYPMPQKEDLIEIYDSNYFQNENFFDGTNETIYGYHDYLNERFTKQLHYRGIMEQVKTQLTGFEKNRSKLLDVGCGFGFLLDAAQDSGFLVEGLEFNGSAVEVAKTKYSFPIHQGDLMLYKGEKKNVVTMFDVIEHLPDPTSHIRKVHEILEPQGLFVITTMDCDSLVSRLLGTRLEDFRRIREHLTFYTRQSLRKALEDNGFEVVSSAFHGHTFRLDFLTERIQLISKPLGNLFGLFIRTFGIGWVSVHLNPMTKMIMTARKKA